MVCLKPLSVLRAFSEDLQKRGLGKFELLSPLALSRALSPRQASPPPLTQCPRAEDTEFQCWPHLQPREVTVFRFLISTKRKSLCGPLFPFRRPCLAGHLSSLGPHGRSHRNT